MRKKIFARIQRQYIQLSQRDAEKVFALLENPPTPNEKLKAAVAKHQDFFCHLNNSNDLKQ